MRLERSKIRPRNAPPLVTRSSVGQGPCGRPRPGRGRRRLAGALAAGLLVLATAGVRAATTEPPTPQLRALLIKAIHSSFREQGITIPFPQRDLFLKEVPTGNGNKGLPGVPDDILDPSVTWDDREAYDEQAKKLADLFKENFVKFEGKVKEGVERAGPK